jgi:hypothetical protein
VRPPPAATLSKEPLGIDAADRVELLALVAFHHLFFPNQMAQANHNSGTKNSRSSSFCRLKISIQAVMELV